MASAPQTCVTGADATPKVGVPRAYVRGEFVPLSTAKIGIATHAFLYGTACFEGIRAYWSEEHEQLYIFRLREHFERLVNSCRVIQVKLPLTVDRMCDVTARVVRDTGYREDVYIRPVAYKSSEVIGVRLHDLEDDFLVFAVPFGAYLDLSKGLKVGVSSWRHVDDNAVPMRAKINGSYINAALAKTEAARNGFDEAIFLSQDGHVSEGSAENLFLLRKGKLVTPPITDDILEGITRETVMILARNELGLETVERKVDRTELYTSEECFLCGTGAQISPVTEIDHRPVGDGKIGPVSQKLQRIYFDCVRGRMQQYAGWLTPVY